MYTYYYTYIYIHKPKRKENINHHLLHQGFKTIDLNNVEEVVNNTHHHGIIARNDKVEFTYLRQTAGGQQTIY